MLKISQFEPVNGTVSLKVEGRIVGPWVAELQQICELALDKKLRLKLDLKDVSFVDDSGATILARLKSRGVILANCSPFLDEQLKVA